MLGSNPSADSVASTDTGGCYSVPLSLSGRRNSISGEAPKRQILGVWGQSPHKHVLPTQTAFLSRAPSHNACILGGDRPVFGSVSFWVGSENVTVPESSARFKRQRPRG